MTRCSAKTCDIEVIQLNESADILEVAALNAQFREVISSGKSVVIDAGQVIRLTTPVVQLLLALEKSLQNNAQSIYLRNPSAMVEEVFTTLGLANKLELWKEA